MTWGWVLYHRVVRTWLGQRIHLNEELGRAPGDRRHGSGNTSAPFPLLPVDRPRRAHQHPSPTLAEHPREAWFAAAKWSVPHLLAVPVVLAGVWQAGVWAPLELESNPLLRAMWAPQAPCSKGKVSECKHSNNIPLGETGEPPCPMAFTPALLVRAETLTQS